MEPGAGRPGRAATEIQRELMRNCPRNRSQEEGTEETCRRQMAACGCWLDDGGWLGGGGWLDDGGWLGFGGCLVGVGWRWGPVGWWGLVGLWELDGWWGLVGLEWRDERAPG